MTEVVISSAARTAIGSYGGALSSVPGSGSGASDSTIGGLLHYLLGSGGSK